MSAAAAGGYGDVDPEAMRKKETYKNIKEGFALFDRDGKGVCDVREIGTIVRHLGICPTEIELRDMITEIEEEEPTGFITYVRFERMMARILLENQCVCHPRTCTPRQPGTHACAGVETHGRGSSAPVHRSS